jgi:hypothetical protein
MQKGRFVLTLRDFGVEEFSDENLLKMKREGESLLLQGTLL